MRRRYAELRESATCCYFRYMHEMLRMPPPMMPRADARAARCRYFQYAPDTPLPACRAIDTPPPAASLRQRAFSYHTLLRRYADVSFTLIC